MDSDRRSDPNPEPGLVEILDSGGVHAVYQPLVDIGSGGIIGYEALARGPAGSELESPARLFSAAHSCGLLAELDRACRAAAVEGAVTAGMKPPLSLFVNVEPGALGDSDPFGPRTLEAIESGELRVIVEFTERALTERPAELIRTVRYLRSLGCGIALDDVGADDRSLALLPFVSPDVIKLDMSLVQERPGPALAGVVHAVSAEVERSGATVVAEGIEHERHLFTATALGARVAQGWHFGRPGPLPSSFPAAEAPLAIRSAPAGSADTPFAAVAPFRNVKRGDKRLLLALSRQLEAHAEAIGSEAVVLATLQDVEFFSAATAAHYERLATRVAFTGVFGRDMPIEPAAGVRGANLERSDPLGQEWTVLVIAPHFAGGFVARDLGDTGPDPERRFDFAMTFDRALVRNAGAILMERVTRREAAPALAA